jgi:hypothetical protein
MGRIIYLSSNQTTMLQLFFKTSAITAADWAQAYERIESIVTHFPLRLLRIESYYRSEPNLDIDHFDLYLDKGTDQEQISFYGDWMSFSNSRSVEFYKNWETHKAQALTRVQNDHAIDKEDETKPITWLPHTAHRYQSDIPQANGKATRHRYIETRGALYEYAILAIAIMLENLLSDKVFLVAPKQEIADIQEVVAWLEVHFKQGFEIPIYFDKLRLFNSFKDEYADKTHTACRLECLYERKYKQNMAFSIEHLGYQPSFDFYAEILSDTLFGTYGFWDVVNPWIAVTQDLESTLNLIAESKKIQMERDGKIKREYDLTTLLKRFLKEFILWTPQQREALNHFYTNKQALETGEESLWGILYRMSGYRVNICPMYATQQELFEAFMYHDPKQGAIFKEIIDTWVVDNHDSFDQLKQKLADAQLEENASEASAPELDEDHEDYRDIPSLDAFVIKYPEHEQFFVYKALMHNPMYANIERGIEKLLQSLDELLQKPEYQDHTQNIHSYAKKNKISYIRSRLKETQFSVHPHLEQWLNEEENENVLTQLALVMSMKLYNRGEKYARYRLLWDRGLWGVWRG